MDAGMPTPQGISGKRNLTHQILWFQEGPKSRESSGRGIQREKIFFAIFHHSVAHGFERFVDNRVG
jgi:hypothetical protein